MGMQAAMIPTVSSILADRRFRIGECNPGNTNTYKDQMVKVTLLSDMTQSMMFQSVSCGNIGDRTYR